MQKAVRNRNGGFKKKGRLMNCFNIFRRAESESEISISNKNNFSARSKKITKDKKIDKNQILPKRWKEKSYNVIKKNESRKFQLNKNFKEDQILNHTGTIRHKNEDL